MVIREDRERLIGIMNDYLHEKITAFEFDDRIHNLRGTRDETVWLVRENLWFYYDDCKDHKVVATKAQWDYFQRLLLLLGSDAELEEWSPRVRWHPTQWIALLLFILSLSVYLVAESLYAGILSHVLLWPFSYWISRSRGRIGPSDIGDVSCYPYKSFRQLLSCRRAAAGFRKETYPPELISRRIRSKLLEMKVDFLIPIFWIVFCPLVLLYQTMPIVCGPSVFRVKGGEEVR